MRDLAAAFVGVLRKPSSPRYAAQPAMLITMSGSGPSDVHSTPSGNNVATCGSCATAWLIVVFPTPAIPSSTARGSGPLLEPSIECKIAFRSSSRPRKTAVGRAATHLSAESTAVRLHRFCMPLDGWVGQAVSRASYVLDVEELPIRLFTVAHLLSQLMDHVSKVGFIHFFGPRPNSFHERILVAYTVAALDKHKSALFSWSPKTFFRRGHFPPGACQAGT